METNQINSIIENEILIFMFRLSKPIDYWHLHLIRIKFEKLSQEFKPNTIMKV